MLFDKTDLYEVEADLDQLRLVDLGGCNGIYDDNDLHTSSISMIRRLIPFGKVSPTLDKPFRPRSSFASWRLDLAMLIRRNRRESFKIY
jgi:hypothetical protein